MNIQQNETHKALELGKKGTKSLATGLETISKFSSDNQETMKKLQKLAKCAKFLGGASAVCDIALVFMGAKDKTELMLEEINNKLDDLKKQVDGLYKKVDDGFTQLNEKSDFLKAQSQIFKAMSFIPLFMSRVKEYNDAKTSAELKTTMDGLLGVEGAQGKGGVNESNLEEYVGNIVDSCTKNNMGATNLLDAAIAHSNANHDYLKRLSTALLNAIATAQVCQIVWWDAVYLREYNAKEEQKKATYDLATYRSERRELIEKDYEKYFLAVGKAIDKALNKCQEWSTVSLHFEPAVERIAKSLFKGDYAIMPIERHAEKHIPEKADRMQSNYPEGYYEATRNNEEIWLMAWTVMNDMIKMWPSTRLIMFFTTAEQVDQFNNLQGTSLGVNMESKTVHKTTEDKSNNLIVIALNANKAFSKENNPFWEKVYDWNKISLKQLLDQFMEYRKRGRLHHYAHDNGVIGKYPYAYFGNHPHNHPRNNRLSFLFMTPGFGHYRGNQGWWGTNLVVPMSKEHRPVSYCVSFNNELYLADLWKDKDIYKRTHHHEGGGTLPYFT